MLEKRLALAKGELMLGEEGHMLGELDSCCTCPLWFLLVLLRLAKEWEVSVFVRES